jgi:DNA-binding transcriptional LysR family regulator
MDIEQVNLNLLRVFHALMTERNVTRAATRLRLTQSATSSALTRLRAVIKDPLFVRTPQGMRPTPKANAIAEPIRQALEHFARALETSVLFDPATSTQTFRIATTGHALFVLLPELARAIENEAPHIRLDIAAIGGEHSVDPMQVDQIDMLIAPFANRGPSNFRAPPNFKVKKLFSDRIVVLVRRDHPKITSRLTATAFAAAEHIVIAPRRGPINGSIDQAMAKAGLRRNIRLTLPHHMVASHVVAASDLLVAMPERVARNAVATLPVRMLPLPIRIPEFTISMAWHERLHLDSGHRWLRDRFVTLCQKV